ncbi:MAG TPA: lamin tail domain-containing protein, partial [Candidatus Limnocylindrales bacterium]|nr:lamin tail domain-containing protein [Candidatus Limnocylindrales bacterium]
MDRVRRAGVTAPFLVLAVSAIVLGGSRTPIATTGQLAAAVTWPTSTLLVSEVVTGGVSASDEFAELTNVGPEAVDLTGFELVYVTSSGGTVTRKAAWTVATILSPGRHLLVANVSGIYAGIADATYSGGFAATGGSIVIRPIGGEPADAVGWGDATNAFVEGSAAPSPAAGSSIERLPGGTLGNGVDTNVNSADFVVRSVPTPQNLAADPAPPQDGSPSPSVAPSPTATPTPTATPSPTPSPTPTPTPT